MYYRIHIVCLVRMINALEYQHIYNMHQNINIFVITVYWIDKLNQIPVYISMQILVKLCIFWKLEKNKLLQNEINLILSALCSILFFVPTISILYMPHTPTHRFQFSICLIYPPIDFQRSGNPNLFSPHILNFEHI